MSRPDGLTATMAGASELQITSSYRRSSLAEYGVAITCMVCPAYSLVTIGSRAILAAGPGKIVTRANAVAGDPPPVGLTNAVTVSVPVAPPATSPVESTEPSKRPPD